MKISLNFFEHIVYNKTRNLTILINEKLGYHSIMNYFLMEFIENEEEKIMTTDELVAYFNKYGEMAL
jgi:hypothetical protein